MQKFMQKLLKSPDSVFKYLTAAILLAIPLYPKFPFIRIPGVQVSIRLEDFLLVVLTLTLAIYLLPKLKQILSHKIERSILIYLAVGLVSLLSGAILTKTLIPQVGFLHWARRIEYFVPFFLGVVAIKKGQNLEFYLKVIMLTLFVVLIYGLGQRYFSWPIIITQNVEYSKGIALRWIQGSHVNSTFAGHYDLATFLVFILPTLICLIAVLKQIKTKIVLSVLALGGLWLLAAAVSRISIASFLLSTSLALILLKKYKMLVVALAVSIVFFSFSSDLAARYSRVIDVFIKGIGQHNLLPNPSSLEVFAQEEVLGQRTRQTPTPTPLPVFEDRSSSIRLNVEWPRALRALAKNPLLGTGYSSITLATDNDYLRALGEVGILGFTAFALIFVRIGKVIVSKVKKLKELDGVQAAFIAGLTGSLVGVLVNALFIDVFEASKFAIIFWLLMGMLIGILTKRKYVE